MTRRARALTGERLVVVTGKGGVGKTSLATAIARLSAGAGLRTILVSFDTRDERHPLLGTHLEYMPYQAERNLAVSRVDAIEAVREYARRNLPFSAFYDGFFRSRAFRDFAAATPGFEDLMCLGKLYDLATGSEFDRVVFDAPATGHLRLLLQVPQVTLETVLVGPLNHNARKIQDLLLDPERTRVVLTTLAEEMAVQEALELESYCREARRMAVGPLVVNRRVTSRFTDAEIESLGSVAAGRAVEANGAEALSAAAAAAVNEHEEARSQEAALARLAQTHCHLLEVPRVMAPKDDGLRFLAALEPHVSSLVGNRRG